MPVGKKEKFWHRVKYGFSAIRQTQTLESAQIYTLEAIIIDTFLLKWPHLLTWANINVLIIKQEETILTNICQLEDWKVLKK